uniref:Uncharacterized protein n=1 Tax=Macrostomum lignano TaxID=282301 RepID=A0A1I8G9G9_9PLAT
MNGEKSLQMSRRFRAEQITLINDLCKRLGFDINSDIFETDSGLLQLLPLIQARLNELQEEDTYRDVEEITTDSCPVLHPNQLLHTNAYKPSASNPSSDVSAAVHSIMRAMVLSQLRRALSAVVLESSSASSSCLMRRDMSSTVRGQQSSTIIEKSLSPLITEIRSDTLLNEVVTSVVRAASETVQDAESNLSSNAHSKLDYSASCSSVKTSKQKKHEKSQTSRTSTASSRSSTSTSSFSGFPCFPSPHSRDDNRGTGSLKEQSIVGSTTNCSQRSRSKRLDAADKRRDAMRHGVRVEEVAARLWEATSGLSCSRIQSSNSSVSDAPRSEDIMSNSNMEARWGGRTLLERRRAFCWPIVDHYRHPYHSTNAVARDNWQFVNLRNPLCPADAQLNRTRRADILEHCLQQRQLDAKNPELDRGAFSPFEFYNGVTHPLGPSVAPCRATFVGQ